MNRPGKKTKLLLWAALVGAGVAGLTGVGASKADEPDQDPVAKRERCAVRVSIATLGTSPNAALQGAADPQSQVDAILKTPEFIERFSRFVNSKFNETPGANSAEDASYHLAKYVLTNNKQWKELFVGQYNVVTANNQVTVNVDPNGLGYFRSRAWMERYAGNELAGLKINTAYRMMQNVLGLKLMATTNAPGADVSATGRQAAACRGCHFDGWFALDKVAEVLGRVSRANNTVTFTPYNGAPQALLGGAAMAKDDKDVVNALVASENFTFNACSLGFQYLYGRKENVCEAPVFDKCVDAIKSTGMIQDGLAAIAKDMTFCQ
jgi:hypothetical protein